MLSRRGAQCAPGQREIIRFVGEHSDSLRAACGGCSLDAHYGGCVRLYGSAGADEFTNGVPRSDPRAPSLAALPQFTLPHPAGYRFEMITRCDHFLAMHTHRGECGFFVHIEQNDIIM